MARRALSLHPIAGREVEHEQRYYDRQAQLGGEFLAAVREAFERVQETPQGSRVEGVVRDLEVRSVRMRKPFPFRVYFVDLGYEVRIYAVAHLKRRPGYWARRVGN